MEKKLDAITLKLQENELELELAKERSNLFGCVDLAGRNTHDAQVERYCCRETPLTVENLSKDVIDSRGRAYLWMVVTDLGREVSYSDELRTSDPLLEVKKAQRPLDKILREWLSYSAQNSVDQQIEHLHGLSYFLIKLWGKGEAVDPHWLDDTSFFALFDSISEVEAAPSSPELASWRARALVCIWMVSFLADLPFNPARSARAYHMAVVSLGQAGWLSCLLLALCLHEKRCSDTLLHELERWKKGGAKLDLECLSYLLWRLDWRDADSGMKLRLKEVLGRCFDGGSLACKFSCLTVWRSGLGGSFRGRLESIIRGKDTCDELRAAALLAWSECRDLVSWGRIVQDTMEVRLECACVQYCGLRCLGRDIVPLHLTVLTAFHHHIHNPSIVSIITTNAAAFDWASVLHPDEASLDTASISLLANLCLRACVVHGQDIPLLSSTLSLLGRLCGLSPALPDRITACLPDGLLDKIRETPGVEDFLVMVTKR